MRVLVTGGAGFIGSNLVDNLLGWGDTVLVVDNLSTGKLSNLDSQVDLIELDIRSPELAKVIKDFRPDAVSHCAAQASVTASMNFPVLDFETNLVGGVNLCQAVLASEATQFVYLSTGGGLYGSEVDAPTKEDDPINPISINGLSKWTLEGALKVLIRDAMPLKILRLANVYGRGQDPKGEAGVVSIFAERMLREEPVKIFGDGEQTRDFVYIDDVVRCHDLALLEPGPLTVNVSSGLACSINRLFQMMAKQTGYTQVPEYREERPGDIRRSRLSNSRAEDRLGWRPRIDLEDGLARTLAWVKENLSDSRTPS